VLDPDFVARLLRLRVRAARVRGREEFGLGRSLHASGDEFVGHRPYRAGEDLRDYDWALLARSGRDFVRVRRSAARARWAVVLDTSASMGLGVPGKLECAAQIAAGIAVAGLDMGASTDVVSKMQSGAPAYRTLSRSHELAAWLTFLREQRASGSVSTKDLLAHARCRAAQRVFVIGDLFDLEPADLLTLARRGRRVHAVRVLARHEAAPELADGVQWLDPEAGEKVELRLDAEALDEYRNALRATLEGWRARFAHHGQRCAVWTSDAAFEMVVAAELS
jgi:uncharacterized protein (DUF58 family)